MSSVRRSSPAEWLMGFWIEAQCAPERLLDRGPLHSDIQTYKPQPLVATGLLAGFPCQADYYLELKLAWIG